MNRRGFLGLLGVGSLGLILPWKGLKPLPPIPRVRPEDLYWTGWKRASNQHILHQQGLWVVDYLPLWGEEWQRQHYYVVMSITRYGDKHDYSAACLTAMHFMGEDIKHGRVRESAKLGQRWVTVRDIRYGLGTTNPWLNSTAWLPAKTITPARVAHLTT